MMMGTLAIHAADYTYLTFETTDGAKASVEMTPGTVIAIPAEVKHWHGAQKDSWFQHLTYHKDVQEGASNEWCEPVDDDTYNALIALLCTACLNVQCQKTEIHMNDGTTKRCYRTDPIPNT